MASGEHTIAFRVILGRCDAVAPCIVDAGDELAATAGHRQADLVIKAEHALAVMRTMRADVEKEGELRVQLRMGGKTDDRAPTDLKLSIQYPEAPAHFLGVQAQIVLNRVQGRPYPYFYAVVLAREGHGLFAAAKRVQLPGSVIREKKSQGDVEVGWEGPMNVAGQEIPVSDYPRMSNPYVEVGFGESLYQVSDGAYTLTLDFESWTRRASGNAAGGKAK